MQRLSLLLVAALLLAAQPSEDVETLLESADSELARENYVEAIRLYEQAEPRCTNPGRINFALATAHYRLSRRASKDALAHLLKAELRYRHCLSPHEPRRPQALYGLGTCLLLKSPGDEDVLREAIMRLRQATEDSKDEELVRRARYNLQLAQFHLFRIAPTSANARQHQPPQGQDPKGGGAEDDPRNNPQLQPRAGHGNQQGSPAGGHSVKQDQRPKAKPTDAPPPQGEGDLPPVPDRDEAAPLAPHHARAHLEEAIDRILEEKRQHRESTARPPAEEVPDW